MSLNKKVFLFALVLLSGCNCLHKEEVAQPKQEKVEERKDLIIINVLDKELYDDCHIKGSVNVPFMDMDNPDKDPIENYVKDLPKDIKLVIYCSNYMCSASGEVAKKLQNMGFDNVWAYEAGMAEWFQNKLPVEGVCKQAYLSRVMNPPKVEHDGFKVISTQELQKLIEERK